MPAESGDYFYLRVKKVGDVAVARVTLAELWKEETIASLAAELAHVADEAPKLVLDLSEVTGLSSRMLGQLAALHKQLRAAGGRLALCQVRPDVAEVIETCKLTTLFTVYPDEQAAVQSFV
jgi:anti-sigma B factor antagonist